MHKTVVIDIVGLSTSVIGVHTPFIQKYISENHLKTIEPLLPAVTTAVQSSYLTGKFPAENGIVGNGWYDHADAEVKFWKQSNKLVNADKIWDQAKKEDPDFTCANMFWWYNILQLIIR
jgi:predicted AlkP superfamily pyrophosphatase or phosphodiesterase